MITLDAFFQFLDSLSYIPGDLIVHLYYKYEHEKIFTDSMEILTYNGDLATWEWLHDWNEGQQEVYVSSYIFIDDICEEDMYKCIKR